MIRFTIRDVLWLTVVVALGCLRGSRRDALAMSTTNQRLTAQIDELTERLKDAQWWANKFHAQYGSPGGLIGGAGPGLIGGGPAKASPANPPTPPPKQNRP